VRLKHFKYIALSLQTQEQNVQVIFE